MAINLPSGFNITTQEPVDARVVLTKAEMKAVVDSRMPDQYFCLCKDDGKLYTYNSNNSIDPAIGKFRLYLKDEFENKQDKLTAGENITIQNNVISSTGGGKVYTAGANIQISDQDVISATDTKYTAGTNITIDANNVISATGGSSYVAGNGINIDSENNTISTKLNDGLEFTSFGSIKVKNSDSSIEVGDLGIGLRRADSSIVVDGYDGVKVNTNVIQPKLTAGTNITIDSNNVISATGGGTSYVAGNGINIDSGNNSISTKVGNGLKYTEDGNITLKTGDRSIAVSEFGIRVPVITTSLDITDNGLAVKIADNSIVAYNSGTGTKGIKVNTDVIQSKLTAGTNVSIDNNVISSIDTKVATSITLGKQITATAAIGGIPAGKVYAATDTLATIIEDLLGGSTPTGDGNIYYSIGSTVPTSVTGMTQVAVQKDTLLSSGYTWKNISLNNEYAFLAIDKSIGITCYQILQNGFSLGYETVDLGSQWLYYPSSKATDTGIRLVYSFEE